MAILTKINDKRTGMIFDKAYINISRIEIFPQNNKSGVVYFNVNYFFTKEAKENNLEPYKSETFHITADESKKYFSNKLMEKHSPWKLCYNYLKSKEDYKDATDE